MSSISSPAEPRPGSSPRSGSRSAARVAAARTLLLFGPILFTLGYAMWVLASLASGPPPADVGQYARTRLVSVALLLVGALGASLLAVRWMHFAQREPLDSLLAQLHGMSDGGVADRVDVRASGDLQEVAAAVNALAARQEDRHRALLQTQKLATVGTLVAGVAHEINNPLTYMKGTTDLVGQDLKALVQEERLPPDTRARIEEAVESLQTTLEGMDRLANIASSLKRVSRPSQGRRGPEDVNALVHECLTLARNDIKGKYVVETHLHAASPALCNGSEVSQVVLNLVINGLQAMPDGGRLILRTRDEPHRVIVEVTDTGPGIPPEVQERLFTPFLTTKPKGTGLGLSISKSIVEAHQGRLVFDTAPGVGTTFRLELPAAEAR